MSPEGTRQMGDLHDLPDCAPAGLQALVGLAEGIIQEQIELLGSGTPSKAPDLRELLRDEGIDKPEDQSTMITEYTNHKTEVEKVRSTYEAEDDGIVVKTAGIGKVVTDAYDAIDASVNDLNDKIDAARANHTWTDGEGKVQHGVSQHLINGVFTGVWTTLDTTYEQVRGVSDQAAAAAVTITDDEPPVSPMRGTTGVQPAAYNGPSAGRTPWSSGRAAAVNPPKALSPGEERDLVLKMMDRLVNQLGFTPAQAAGIIGNAKHESNFSTTVVGDLDLADKAHGLFQWRGARYAGLQKFAAENGMDPNAWETQIDYMAAELRNNNTYQEAENLIDANKNDPSKVAMYFDEKYEISSGSTTPQRQQYAVDTLKTWEDTQAAAV
ncbi:phage tail tip lysozyme [Nocardia sp. NPDC003963]